MSKVEKSKIITEGRKILLLTIIFGGIILFVFHLIFSNVDITKVAFIIFVVSLLAALATVILQSRWRAWRGKDDSK